MASSLSSHHHTLTTHTTSQVHQPKLEDLKGPNMSAGLSTGLSAGLSAHLSPLTLQVCTTRFGSTVAPLCYPSHKIPSPPLTSPPPLLLSPYPRVNGKHSHLSVWSHTPASGNGLLTHSLYSSPLFPLSSPATTLFEELGLSDSTSPRCTAAPLDNTSPPHTLTSSTLTPSQLHKCLLVPCDFQ